MGGSKMNLEKRILVMGLTGSGKSRFISEMCEYFSQSSKDPAPPAKPGLDLDTHQVKEFPITTDKGDRVTLVDTPGFDNMSMSDMDILGVIMKWMSASHSANAPVNGIIYLHRISDPRMTPAAIASLRVLQKFCGESNFPAVALATTFWDYGYSSQNLREQYQSKYQDLKLTYWKGLLDKGSQAFPYDDGSSTGRDVIQYFCGRKQSVLFDFQKETVDQGLCVEQTSAGIELQGPFGKEKQLLQTQLATLNDNLSEKEKAIGDLKTEKQLFEAQISDLNDNLSEKEQVNIELRESMETEKKSLKNNITELRGTVQEKEEIISRLHMTLGQEKQLFETQVSDLNDNLCEKDKVNTELRESMETEKKSLENKITELRSTVQEKEEAITSFQDSFMKEERLWHDKITELGESIQEKNDELARLKGQQSIQHSQQAVNQVGAGIGLPFRAYRGANKTVKSIEVYWGGLLLLHYITGIRITWSDGDRSQLYGMPALRRVTYDFAENERIQSMSIDAAVHVYRIEFTTNMGSFRAGGRGGVRSNVDVGNGVILGIEGVCGGIIHKLGVVFG